mgnify:CR=1 FL=1
MVAIFSGGNEGPVNRCARAAREEKTREQKGDYLLMPSHCLVILRPEPIVVQPSTFAPRTIESGKLFDFNRYCGMSQGL